MICMMISCWWFVLRQNFLDMFCPTLYMICMFNNGLCCRQDFLDMFAPRCGGCGHPILDNYISALSRHWHPECFVCRVSSTNLSLEPE